MMCVYVSVSECETERKIEDTIRTITDRQTQTHPYMTYRRNKNYAIRRHRQTLQHNILIHITRHQRRHDDRYGVTGVGDARLQR